MKSINRAKTTEPRPGEIWWCDRAPFEDRNYGKGRPVLVVRCDNTTVSYMTCTSQVSEFRSRVAVSDLELGGLEKPTYVDSEIRRIPRGRLAWKMGRLCSEDWALVRH